MSEWHECAAVNAYKHTEMYQQVDDVQQQLNQGSVCSLTILDHTLYLLLPFNNINNEYICIVQNKNPHMCSKCICINLRPL